MTASTHRQVPIALIPWVFALVALLGCNALVPNAVSMRKGKDLDGTSVSQVAVEAAPVESISTPLVFLMPDPSDGSRLTGPLSSRLAIENGPDLTVVSGRDGEVRGRAPPVEGSC